MMRKVSQEGMDLTALIIMYIGFSISAVSPTYLNAAVNSRIQMVLLLGGMIYFLFSYFTKRGAVILKPSTIGGKILLFLWGLFSISVFASEALKGTIPTDGIGYLFIIPVFFFLIIPNVLNLSGMKIIKAIFYSNFIFVVLSLLIAPENFGNNYLGIMTGSNSLGIIAFQSALSSMIIMLVLIQTNSFKNKIALFYFISLFISLIVLFQSGSRTSFVAFLVGAIVSLVINISVDKVKIKQLVIPIILFVLFYVLFLKEIFLDVIINKFLQTEGNSLSGRDVIWRQILENTSTLGHGKDYFNNIIHIEAHNNFLEVLGIHGLISVILLVLFFIVLLINSIHLFYREKSNPLSFIPLVFVTSYLTLGMAESIFGVIEKNPTMAFYSICGILIFEMSYKVNSKNKQII